MLIKTDLHRLFLLLTLIFGGGATGALEPETQEFISIRDTVEVQNFSDVAVCTDSALVAARLDHPSIALNRVNHSWHIIELQSGRHGTTVDAGDSLNMFGYLEGSYPQWSPDCRWLYYRALYDNEVQVWRLDALSGLREQVTFDDADILRFVLAENGQELTYETSASRSSILSAEHKEYENGVLIDESLRPFARLTRTFPIFGRWAPVRRWDVTSQGHLLSRERSTFKSLAIRDHKVETLAESKAAERMRSGANWVTKPNLGFAIAPSRNHAAIMVPLKKNVYETPLLIGLALVTATSPAEINYCDDPRCVAEKMALLKWAEDGSAVYFIAEEKRGAAGIFEWVPSTGKVRTIMETEGLLGAVASDERRYQSQPCPTFEDIVVCTASDSQNPPRLLAISIASGLVRTMYDPNAELRKRFTLKTKRVSWKDTLGRDAVGVLVYPRKFKIEEHYPLVITTYRCPGFLTGGIADGGPEYALAENGFLVLCIERNADITKAQSTKYSLAEARYIAALAEFQSAIDLLVGKGLADRRRVGITGLSFSAQAASYALAHSDDFSVASLRAFYIWEPEFQLFFRPGMALSEAVSKDHNTSGHEENTKSKYQNISVALQANQISAPVLVQASDSEYIGGLPALVALQRHDKAIDMIVFPDETHQLYQPMHRAVNFERSLDWFRFWLQGYEDPGPKKRDQYIRWHRLRQEQCDNWELESLPSYCN